MKSPPFSNTQVTKSLPFSIDKLLQNHNADKETNPPAFSKFSAFRPYREVAKGATSQPRASSIESIKPQAIVREEGRSPQPSSSSLVLQGSNLGSSNDILKQKCICSVCGKQLSRPYSLKVHQRSHSGEKTYPCTYEDCDRVFTRCSTLTIHQRTHTGEKPYQCREEGCEKMFAQSNTRDAHERTHTGEKPYQCRKGCAQVFPSSSNRSRHERTIHSGPQPTY
ncbi:MAG: C2H2-type zinc finger protein [Sphingobacteriaceae bacterium]|nr:MAG: C2H2-type zinc finger protein [Sphingobacteriaceae bacterium]